MMHLSDFGTLNDIMILLVLLVSIQADPGEATGGLLFARKPEAAQGSGCVAKQIDTRELQTKWASRKGDKPMEKRHSFQQLKPAPTGRWQPS